MSKTIRRKADTIARGTDGLNEPIFGNGWLQSDSTATKGLP
ncbi:MULTISPECIES: hypothetical protein [unclassified Rhodanobacter]|uniref:Uncharacterized protein n=1 Tax=Rhodanobacter humi TaxID=1888173 RepID=A0ABV4AUA2_9GAMM